jgi:hypothetical protein
MNVRNKQEMNDKEIAAVKLAGADPHAQELVKAVQSILAEGAVDVGGLKQSLVALFEYLSSEDGRTDANCRAVDSFFMFDGLWVERNLPDAFHDIFADTAGALHDTVSAPEVAERFDSTPEQLLKRARELITEQPAPPDVQ